MNKNYPTNNQQCDQDAQVAADFIRAATCFAPEPSKQSYERLLAQLRIHPVTTQPQHRFIFMNGLANRFHAFISTRALSASLGSVVILLTIVGWQSHQHFQLQQQKNSTEISSLTAEADILSDTGEGTSQPETINENETVDRTLSTMEDDVLLLASQTPLIN